MKRRMRLGVTSAINTIMLAISMLKAELRRTGKHEKQKLYWAMARGVNSSLNLSRTRVLELASSNRERNCKDGKEKR
jgi:hypothetical protein